MDLSVRGTSSTGEQNRQKPRIGIFGLINRIPNSFLASPEKDRDLLALAVEKLLRQGLGEPDVRALFSGMERLQRPFPALMRRLGNLTYALDFLNGSLGRGIHTSPPRPSSDGNEASTGPDGFRLDSLGRATGTCPAHGHTRNVPGGNCAICGGPCRSTPGQIMPEPGREAAAPTQRAPRSTPESESSDPPVGSAEAALVPELRARMLVSLNGGERAPAAEPVSESTPRSVRASGLSPETLALLDQLREGFERPRCPGRGADKISRKAAMA